MEELIAPSGRIPLSPGEIYSFHTNDGTQFVCKIRKLISDASSSGLFYEAEDGHYPSDDYHSSRKFIIKECYPKTDVLLDREEKNLTELLERKDDGTICVKESLEKQWREVATARFNAYKNHYLRTFKINQELYSIVAVNSSPFFTVIEEKGTVYLFSLYQEGITLFELFRNEVESLEAPSRLLVLLCKLLAILHEKGYVYLDVKPENILALTYPSKELIWQVSFFDFDSLQRLEDLAENRLDAPSMSYGFSPKEQREVRCSDIGTESDIYSIGATLHWIVTGKTPEPENDLEDVWETYPWEPRHSLEMTPREEHLLGEIFSHTLVESPFRRWYMKELENKLEDLQEASRLAILSNLPIEDSFTVRRESDCEKIASAIKATGMCTVWGSPGLGKTELAKEYARQALKTGAYDTVAFLVADGSLSSAVSQLWVREKHINYLPPEENLARKLDIIRGSDKRTLIILDNYSGIDYTNHMEAECHDALFSGTHCLLITQRNPDHTQGAIEIEPLDEDGLVSLYFANRHNAVDRCSEEYLVRSRLLSAIASHTMILVLAARLLDTKSNYSLVELCREFENSLAHGSYIPVIIYNGRGDPYLTYIGHIERLLDISGLAPIETMLLSLLSMLPAKGLDQDIVCALCTSEDFDGDAFDVALYSLIGRGFVNRAFVEGIPLITLHPLVSDFAAEMLVKSSAQNSYLEKLMSYMSDSYEGIDCTIKANAAALGQAALRRHPTNSAQAAHLHSLVGLLFFALGDYPQALAHQQEALRMREAALPAGHPDIATSHGNIASAYRALGDYPQALAHQQEALRMREAALPAGHPDIAMSHSDIGANYRALGNPVQALAHDLEALAMFEAALPAGHPDIATSHSNIGADYCAIGDYTQALAHHKEALAMFGAVLPAGHPDIATSHRNIAVIYRSLGEYETQQ